MANNYWFSGSVNKELAKELARIRIIGVLEEIINNDLEVYRLSIFNLQLNIDGKFRFDFSRPVSHEEYSALGRILRKHLNR